MNFKKLISTSVLMVATICYIQAQTRVIAHRGFWKTEGSAQNSIAALQKADSIGCYGSEFDVWMTKDNQLVVNHDANFKSKSMEKSNGKELMELQLDNGEKLPSLKQYLKAGKKVNTRLILELKSLNSKQRETKAVEQVVAMIKKMKLEDRVEYIAFSLHATKEFIRLAPAGTPVFYLNGDLSPKELKEIGCAGADYHLGVFRKHPEWIEELHKLGMKVNVWTVNKAEDMQWLIDRKVDFITTNEPLVLQQLLK